MTQQFRLAQLVLLGQVVPNETELSSNDGSQSVESRLGNRKVGIKQRSQQINCRIDARSKVDLLLAQLVVSLDGRWRQNRAVFSWPESSSKPGIP